MLSHVFDHTEFIPVFDQSFTFDCIYSCVSSHYVFTIVFNQTEFAFVYDHSVFTLMVAFDGTKFTLVFFSDPAVHDPTYPFHSPVYRIFYLPH